MRQETQEDAAGSGQISRGPIRRPGAWGLRSAVAMLALAVWGAAAEAQQTAVESARSLLARQTEGQLLRVHDRSGRLFAGAYAGLTADSLRLGPPESDVTLADGVTADRTLALSQVQRIERRGRSIGRGAWITGVAGALAGGFLGAVIHELCESDCGSRAGGALSLGAFGGGAGAVFGAIVGAAIPRWHEIWP